MSRIIGVDLGRSKDPAALVAIRRDPTDLQGHRWEVSRLSIRRSKGDREQWAQNLAAWVDAGPEDLTVLDGTGPHRATALDMLAGLRGRAVVLQIRRQAAVSEDPRVHPVPKAELIEALRSGLETVKCPRRLEYADELHLQLCHFTLRNPDDDPSESQKWAAEPGYHDDLVLAMAMALWARARFRRLGAEIPYAR